MFRKIAAKESAQSALLNEAWRINRTKVQYGYYRNVLTFTDTRIISTFESSDFVCFNKSTYRTII